jgi:hypothetical protein
LRDGEIGDSVEFVLVSPISQLAKEIVIATNPTARKGDKQVSQVMVIKASAGYKVLSSEVIDGKTVKTYGAKVWEGQAVESGDLVECLNWKGQASIQRLTEWLEGVDRNPAKGEMGYDIWAIEPVAKRK